MGSYTHGPFTYNFLKDQGYTFISIARKETELRIVFAFLKNLVQIFSRGGNDKEGYVKEIQALLVQYRNPEDVDKIKRISNELEEVKEIMRDNLANVVNVGIKLEYLDASAGELANQGTVFKQKADKVVEVVWWRNIRCYIISGVVLVIVILIIVIAACGGFDFHMCKSQ